MEDKSQKPFRDMTPDEVAESTKQKVGQGVASVADAAERATRKTEKAGTKTKEAVRSTGQASREIGGVAAAEARKTRDAVKDASDEP